MSSIITVYTPGFKSVLTLPISAVYHVPEGPSNRFVLCANFDASHPSSCSMGDTCKFVHANTGAAREHCIHVNYAWRSIEDCTYDRLPAGQVLRVAPPNSKVASDVMDSDLVLKTRALTSHRRPLSHCAHYYFNRTCNLGADCQFIHAIFVDPTAKPFQRAPVPSQLGEGRELQLSKKQREARRGGSEAAMSSAASEVGTIKSSPLPLNFLSKKIAAAAAAAIVAEEEHVVTSPAVSEASSTPRSHCSSCAGCSMRFRYNPYSASTSKVVLCCA